MKYSEARPLIKSGDLLAFSEGNWSTWQGIKISLVRMFTRSTYSHVALAWVVGGRVFALEAVVPKLRIYPLSQLGTFYHIPMGAPWRDLTEEFALSKIGTEYSQSVAIKAFFAPLEEGNVQECAAYAREVLLLDGINLGNRAVPDSIVFEAQKLGANLILVQ
jgi:hypothetical protein